MKKLDELLKQLRNQEMPLDIQALLRESRVERIRTLTKEEYAAELCAAVVAYNYPSVTCYDFDAFLRRGGYVPYEQKHPNMEGVENVIGKQLASQDLQEIEDGLSNVLYWGYANDRRFLRHKIQRLREEVTYQQLETFEDAVGGAEKIDLDIIESMHIPEFGQMSFASKLLMFLSPDTSPVLDTTIAEFAQRFNIPPLCNIKLSWDGNSIPMTNAENMKIYKRWSTWCSAIAKRVNDEPSSTCDNLRTVDVERAIFWQIQKCDYSKAHSLLKGPDTGIELS